MDFRIDVLGKISNIKRTPQGGLDIPANLTRTGVFEYRQPDGSVVRELRHPQEVFDPRALETMAGSPLTVGHPGIVRADNWQQLAVGHVRDDVHKDGKFVAARVLAQSAPVVDRIEKKELVELSCGYTCDVEHTPGTYEGEKYDAIQRNIRYNHVAVLPEGAGRAGSEVKLHLDAAASFGVSYALSMTPEEIDRLRGELAGAQARADAAEKRLAEIDVDALVNDRLALVQDAKTVLGSAAKFDGQKDIEVMRSACAKAFPGLKLDSASEDYLRGLFVAAVATAKTGQANVAKANVRVDETALEDKIADARKRNEQRSKDAWKGKK